MAVLGLAAGFPRGEAAARYFDDASEDATAVEALRVVSSAEAVESPVYFTASSDRAVAFDRDDRAHVVYGGDHLYHAVLENGAWVTETVDDSGGTGGSAVIAINSSGESDVIHVAYQDSQNDTLKYAVFSGEEWDTTEIGEGGDVNSIALDGDGSVHISHYFGSEGSLLYATNAIGDGSWRTETVEDAYSPTGQYNSIVVDDSDRIHISYHHKRSTTDYGLSYAVKTIGDTVWTITDLYTGSLYYTSLGMDSGGGLHICFYATTLKYISKPAGSASWGSAETLDTTSSSGYYCSLAVDAGDGIHVGYYDSANRDLKYVAGVSGAWETPQTVDDAYSRKYNMAVAIDGSSDPLITYYDATESSLKYATRTGEAWEVQTLATRGEVGKYASLDTDSSGNAHIAYFDDANDDLKYATNSSGDWVTATIDEAGGQYSSLKVDVSGNVHIAYHDGTNGELKYATNASGSWDTDTVDDDEFEGQGCGMALDADGAAHIIYNEEDLGDETVSLKYATNKTGRWRKTSDLTNHEIASGAASVIVDAGGVVHASYYSDFSGGALMYATNLGGSWSLDYPDGDDCDGEPGRYSSIALDSSNNPVFSYYDADDDALELATRNEDDGAWTCTSFATNDDEGSYTSLVLDDNDVFLAYINNDDGSLKFLTNSVDEGDSWSGAVLDDEHWGQYASLARDDSGYFHVAYYDSLNRDLRYIRFALDTDADGAGGSDDCDDSDPDVYNGAPESCDDGKDNDCDGSTDEASGENHPTWYADGDGDHYGNATDSVVACSQPSGHVADASDCDDAHATVYPEAPEICGDPYDNDCDGNLDESCAFDFGWDADGDGDGYSEASGDCDDSSAGISPGAAEVCDGVDNDCDDTLDEYDADVTDAVSWHADADGDGFGDDDGAIVSCNGPAFHVLTGGDCDDNDSGTHPRAGEACDGKDNDCDGLAEDPAMCPPSLSGSENESSAEEAADEGNGGIAATANNVSTGGCALDKRAGSPGDSPVALPLILVCGLIGLGRALWPTKSPLSPKISIAT